MEGTEGTEVAEVTEVGSTLVPSAPCYTSPVITFRDVSLTIQGKAVLQGVSFKIAPGEFVCLTGGSGAGKTSLLHLLLGLHLPSSGVVAVDGVDLRTLSPTLLQLYRRSLGTVLRECPLLPDETIAANVAFPLTACGTARASVLPAVTALLARLDLTERAKAFPADLTHAECARALLARSLVNDPKVVILDDPLDGLPAQDREALLHVIHEANATGATVVLATRESSITEAFPCRLLTLQEGKLTKDTRVRPSRPAPPVPTLTEERRTKVYSIRISADPV